MPIKLIAVDLDGTLLVDWHTMTGPVEAMARAASEHGMKVVIATGREFTAAAKFYQQLDLTTPIICFQGGLIYNAHTDETSQKDKEDQHVQAVGW